MMRALDLLRVLQITCYRLRTDGQLLTVTHDAGRMPDLLKDIVTDYASPLSALLLHSRATSDRLLDVIAHGPDVPPDAPMPPLPTKVAVRFIARKKALR